MMSKKHKEDKSFMNFVKVNTEPKVIENTEVKILPTPLHVESKNDIEIVINKGVRVLISPNIEPMQMIKIIELLKDL